MLKQPLVSVIIPVYNREDTIKRAIDSVLKQTYQNIELIIVDDGSTDGTRALLEQLNSKKIKIIDQNHKGANAARNLGLLKAEGEFIAFQDSDDEWLLDKLERQINYMLINGFEVCYCPFYLYKAEEEEIYPPNYNDKIIYEENLIDVLRAYNVVSTQTLVIHRNIVSEIGMFDEQMPRFQDYEYIIRIAQKKKIGYLNKPLVKVYRTNNSISNDDDKFKDAYLKLLKRHEKFLDIELYLEDNLKYCIECFDKDSLDQLIESIDEYVQMYLKDRKINVYKIVGKYYRYVYQLNRDSYVKEYELRIEKLKSHDFAIYGAGHIGKKIYRQLLQKGLRPQCFLVTKKEDVKELYGVPVIELNEWTEKGMEIIIGVSIEIQCELIDNLIQSKCMNYFRYPYQN